MKRISIIGVGLAAVMVMAAAMWSSQLVLRTSIVVQSVSEPQLKLTLGGPGVKVRVTGQSLDKVTGCAILLNGVLVQDLKVTLGAGTATYKDITLQASPTLTRSVSGYRLRLSAGTQTVDVPANVFVVDVVAPARTTASAPLTVAFPPPNVDTTRLPSEARAGKEITFWGRDFLPDRFEATIGSTVLVSLYITYRSTSQIRARLPEQVMAGPLVVSHGTESSRVQLRPVFKVCGQPVITAVRPASFRPGDWVDLTGRDLHRTGPASSDILRENPWVGISDSANFDGTRMLLAQSWSVTADGTSARFQAGLPQPAVRATLMTLSGKLRLKDLDFNDWRVASPSPVTWTRGDALRIDSVHPVMKWNNQNVDFILLKEQTMANGLMAQGFGILDGTQAKMGAVSLVTGPCSGAQGEFYVPYNATTNFVQFSRAGATVQFPRQIRAAAWPKWDPSVPLKLEIVLNTEYTLRGWGFKPTGITGLAYTLDFVFAAGLPLQVQIIEHTDNQIRFKVATTGPLPANYMNYNEFNPQSIKQFHLNGRYLGGTPKSLINLLYILKAQ